jgi:hypothetical protein
LYSDWPRGGRSWRSEFESRQGLGIFLFATASRPALGPIEPPIQWIPRVLSPGVKRPGREADHSPPSSAEVKKTWRYTSTPQYAFMAWCLVKHRDNFIYTFNFIPYTEGLIIIIIIIIIIDVILLNLLPFYLSLRNYL